MNFYKLKFYFYIFLVSDTKKKSWFRPFTKIISKLKKIRQMATMQIPFTFFSELKSPGQVIVLSFSSRNVWIYSKPGVNFPLDVMTAPDTTDPTLLISCSSKGWKLKHGGVLLFTILASMSLHRNVRNSHNLPTLLENSKLSQKIQFWEKFKIVNLNFRAKKS